MHEGSVPASGYVTFDKDETCKCGMNNEYYTLDVHWGRGHYNNSVIKQYWLT